MARRRGQQAVEGREEGVTDGDEEGEQFFVELRGGRCFLVGVLATHESVDRTPQAPHE